MPLGITIDQLHVDIGHIQAGLARKLSQLAFNQGQQLLVSNATGRHCVIVLRATAGESEIQLVSRGRLVHHKTVFHSCRGDGSSCFITGQNRRKAHLLIAGLTSGHIDAQGQISSGILLNDRVERGILQNSNTIKQGCQQGV